MIAVDDEETAKMIREHLDDFADKMKQSPGVVEESVDIHVAYAENLSLMHYEMVSIRKESVAGTQASSVQERIQERMIWTIQERRRVRQQNMRYRPAGCIILRKALFSRFRN